jgi:hypothetical protein
MPADNTPIDFRLTRHDEWPRHQTGATFDVVADQSPHWSDGYYFTLGDAAGDVAFFMGFRLYPNNDVLDCFACVSHAGRQHNMRYSRRLRPAIDELTCGPMSVEIIEGLRTLRTVAAPNGFGISFDILWEGFAPPYNENYILQFSGGRKVSERSNYDQCSLVSGTLEIDGSRFEVDHQSWVGVRDHSWGVGSVGGIKHPDAAPLVDPPPPFGLRQWCVFKFDDRAIFYQFHHSAAGETTKFESRVMYPYGAAREPWSYRAISHDLNFVELDGRRLRRLVDGTIELHRPDGGADRFRIETISDPVYLQGGGYWRSFDDGRGRGVFRGEYAEEGEVWDVSHPTAVDDPKGLLRLRADSYAETWGRWESLDRPGEVGHGHLECVVTGAYPGFDDL